MFDSNTWSDNKTGTNNMSSSSRRRNTLGKLQKVVHLNIAVIYCIIVLSSVLAIGSLILNAAEREAEIALAITSSHTKNNTVYVTSNATNALTTGMLNARTNATRSPNAVSGTNNTTNQTSPAVTNTTKLTTTQGNTTTNANAASPFPIKENNSTKVFPPNNHAEIVKGAALLRDKAFQPNPINVKAGGTVIWTNKDTVTHTITSGSGFNDPKIGKEFDSGELGSTFAHRFFKPGVYPYFCQIHPTMIGDVIVK